jgi:hypothetical protein
MRLSRNEFPQNAISGRVTYPRRISVAIHRDLISIFIIKRLLIGRYKNHIRSRERTELLKGRQPGVCTMWSGNAHEARERECECEPVHASARKIN